MKKLFIMLVFISGIAFCSAHNDLDHKIFIEKCLKPTVLIESKDQTSTGTGVIVKSEKLKYTNVYFNIVFSCEHIIKSNKQIVKYSEFDDNGIFLKYQENKAIVFFKDSDADISILFFTSDSPMPIAESDFKYQPKIRDRVFTIGHGMGDNSRYSDGCVTGSTKTKDMFVDYKTSIPIVFGDSGGPLFYNNKLIGIANSIRSISVADKIKVPVYNISTFKSLNLFNKILKESNLSKENLEEVQIPEIVGIDIWLKDQLNIIKN